MTEEVQGALEELTVAPQIPEAPASLNIRFSMNQFECLLTIRALEGDGFPAASKLVAGLPLVLERLYKKGAQPIFGKNGPPAKAPEPESGQEREHWCSEHNCEFTKKTKDGKSWYSHPIGDTGKWCNEAKK